MRIASASVVRVRLTRKLANQIDGVDLKPYHVGDVLELPVSDARLLVAERWAFLERRQRERADDVGPRRRSGDRTRRRRRHYIVPPRRGASG